VVRAQLDLTTRPEERAVPVPIHQPDQSAPQTLTVEQRAQVSGYLRTLAEQVEQSGAADIPAGMSERRHVAEPVAGVQVSMVCVRTYTPRPDVANTPQPGAPGAVVCEGLTDW
jgi:hypothetical protein